MNDLGKSTFTTHPDPVHKPRISPVRDGDDIYFSCSDGGLTLYGYTRQEAFDNLMACRG